MRRQHRGNRAEQEVRQRESVGIVAAISRECFLDVSFSSNLKLHSKLVTKMFKR